MRRAEKLVERARSMVLRYPRSQARRPGERNQESLKVVGEGALRRGRRLRRWAFFQVYAAQRPIEEVAACMGVSPPALVELMRRATATVEREVLDRLGIAPETLHAVGAGEVLADAFLDALREFARA